MQVVSDAWKAAHTARLLDENYLEITVEVGDPESMSDGTASDNGAASISNTAKVTEGVYLSPPKFATLELNMWLLDKSYEIIPDTHPEDTGYIGSSLCDENGAFADPPVLSVNFSKVHDRLIPGVTVTWSEEYDEYPTRFKVTAYNGDTAVAEAEITGNDSAVTQIPVDINHYNRIDVTVLAWCLPYRRARISEVFVGLKKLYKKSEIMSYNNSTEIFVLSDKLPKYEIDFEVSNIDGAYDPNNPQGMTKYLMERQAVSVRYGMKVNGKPEYISGGRYYLSEWESPQNGITARFKARDTLEYLRGTYYRGTYNSGGTTLYTLAESVLTDAGLPIMRDGTNPWTLDESLKSITTTAPLPICSIAECLQLIASAARCVLMMQRDGRIAIVPMQTEPTDYAVAAFNSYKKPELELSKQLKNVSVDVYSYFTGTAGVELYSGTVAVSGTQKVTVEYAESAVNVSASVSGGTLVSAAYYTNACVLEITGSGNVTIVLTGTQLKSSKSAMEKAVSEDGESESLSNPLITSTEVADAVASHIVAVLTNRRTFDLDWRVDTRLDAGDIIRINNTYGSEDARITKLKYTYTGAYHGTGTARATK